MTPEQISLRSAASRLHANLLRLFPDTSLPEVKWLVDVPESLEKEMNDGPCGIGKDTWQVVVSRHPPPLVELFSRKVTGFAALRLSLRRCIRLALQAKASGLALGVEYVDLLQDLLSTEFIRCLSEGDYRNAYHDREYVEHTPYTFSVQAPNHYLVQQMSQTAMELSGKLQSAEEMSNTPLIRDAMAGSRVKQKGGRPRNEQLKDMAAYALEQYRELGNWKETTKAFNAKFRTSYTQGYVSSLNRLLRRQ